MKVLLVEDDDALRDEWLDALKSGATHAADEVHVEAEENVSAFVDQLEGRREAARSGARDEPYTGEKVDTTDVLIIDYDLTLANVALTGRRVSYLARCYSSCGVIILLNERGDSWFDLRLHGDLEAVAQVNVGGRQLANPGLWRGGRPEHFRPWEWPVVTKAVIDQASRVEMVSRDLDAPAMETLGIPSSVVQAMPRSIVEVLWTHGDLGAATFNDLGASLLRRKDQLGLAGRARLVAAQLASWLETIVLPGQNVLVDAPHLVSRYPSLLMGPREEVSTWDGAADLSLTAEAAGIDVEKIEAARLTAGSWVSRPVWFWSAVSENQAIAEVRDPWSSRTAPFVFAEDLSRFLPPDVARAFTSDVDSPFVRRFARGPSDGDPFGRAVDYIPAQRFAM